MWITSSQIFSRVLDASIGVLVMHCQPARSRDARKTLGARSCFSRGGAGRRPRVSWAEIRPDNALERRHG
jgi:hypothetical protein